MGEPINPEAWMWYHEHIGRGRCPIVDTWWQTETGAIMISPLPGATATKPGSCTQPLPGIDATIVDARGNEVKGADAGGYLVIRKPWPSMLRTIWGDNERYLRTYWETFQNRYYVAGDSAHRDKDGYFWIMGRIDDVLNVAGHRLGTMEIESALVAHPKVAEAAVVGRRTRSRVNPCSPTWCCAAIAPPATRPRHSPRCCATTSPSSWAPSRGPDDIRFADNLPKTRSGKIMRRLLRAIARNEDITQDLSTLENPAIIDQLRGDEVCRAAASREGAEHGRQEAKAEAEAEAEGHGARRQGQGREAKPRPSRARKSRAKRRRRSVVLKKKKPAARRKK